MSHTNRLNPAHHAHLRSSKDVQVIGQQIQANVNSNSILSAEIESAEIELSASAGRDGVIELGS